MVCRKLNAKVDDALRHLRSIETQVNGLLSASIHFTQLKEGLAEQRRLVKELKEQLKEAKEGKE